MSDPKLKVVIEVDGKQYAAELDRVAKQTEDVGKKSQTSAAGVSHLAGQVKALYGAFAAYGALNLVKNIVDTNAEFQKLNASLVTVTGSAAAADHAFSMIEKFATTTPYQLQEVVEAFIKLKALGLDASEESLRSYGNTASAMGKSLDQMIEAVADAATGEFERLKEFGIKASVQGDQVSLRFKGVTTTIGNNAAEITQYLRRIGDTDFAGGMARQMDTLGGKFSNMGDAAGALARSIGKAGLNDLIGDITEGVTSLTIAIDTFVKDPDKLPDWAKIGAFTLFKLKQEFIDLGDVIGATGAILNLEVGPGFFDRLDTILEARREKRQQIEKETEAFVAKLEGIGKTATTVSAAPLDSGSGKPPAGGSIGKKNHQDLAQATAEDILRAQYTEAEKLSDELLRLNALWNARIISTETYARAINDAAGIQNKYIAGLTEQERILLDMRTAQEVYSDEVTKLTAYLQAGIITEDEYIARLVKAQDAMTDMAKTGKSSMEELSAASKGWKDDFTNDLVEAARTGKLSFSDMVDSMANDLLRIQIQQGITNPLWASLGASLFGGSPGTTPAPSTGAVIAHTGAIIGSEGGYRAVNASVFAGAPRYHTGGIAGDEVPAILRRGEGVFTEAQMRALGSGREVRVVLENRGAPKEAQQAQVNFDAKGMVVTIMLDDIQRGGPVSGALGRTFGMQRAS